MKISRSINWKYIVGGLLIIFAIYVTIYPHKPQISEKDNEFYTKALVVGGKDDPRSWDKIGDEVLAFYRKGGFNIDGNKSEWQIWQWVDENAKLDKEDEKIWRQCIEKRNKSDGLKYCSDQHWIYSKEKISWEMIDVSFGTLKD